MLNFCRALEKSRQLLKDSNISVEDILSDRNGIKADIQLIIGSRIRLRSRHFPGEYLHASASPQDTYRNHVLSFKNGQGPDLRSGWADWVVHAVEGAPSHIRLAPCNTSLGSYLYAADNPRAEPRHAAFVWREQHTENADVLSKARFEVETGEMYYKARSLSTANTNDVFRFSFFYYNITTKPILQILLLLLLLLVLVQLRTTKNFIDE